MSKRSLSSPANIAQNASPKSSTTATPSPDPAVRVKRADGFRATAEIPGAAISDRVMTGRRREIVRHGKTQIRIPSYGNTIT
jgi:hypothetical protein